MKHTLIFIRHGETDWNAEERLQGQRDTPMNARGRAQAKRNGEALRAAIPDVAGFDFVASPLARARDTMEILRTALGLAPAEYRIDPRLIEITFGAWEGHTFAELEAAGTSDIRARRADKWGFVPPGGESYAMLAARVDRWLETLDRDTVAVSHGAVGRVLRGRLLGVPDRDVPLLPAPQDQVLVWRDGYAEWV